LDRRDVLIEIAIGIGSIGETFDNDPDFDFDFDPGSIVLHWKNLTYLQSFRPLEDL